MTSTQDLKRREQLENQLLARQEKGNHGLFSEEQKLQASDKQNFDQFGCSVAISGNWAIVGALGEDNNEDNGGDSVGAAYMFHYHNGQWSETQKLRASDQNRFDFFGRSVAISGDWAIVGADGEHPSSAAYTFHYQKGKWSETQKLQCDVVSDGNSFGRSVSISGDWIIVGSWLEDIDGIINAGAAYIYQYQSEKWVPTQKLQAPVLQESAHFGYSVSISGDRAIIGAYGSDRSVGKAYIFHYQNEQWEPTPTLQSPGNTLGDYFGCSVAINGDRAIIGASKVGNAYIFEYQNEQWEPIPTLQAHDKEDDDYFGVSVSISGDRAIIGAYLEDTGGSGAGAAYK